MQAVEGTKELTGACLRLLAQLWLRYPDAIDWGPLFEAFFDCATVLLPRMEVRSAACSAGLEGLWKPLQAASTCCLTNLASL